jgi:3-oxoacyl-[acyl-carrier-protein] synthase-3
MSYLRAFGKYLPERVVTNDELAAALEVEPSWIVSSCGIEERRYACDDQTLVDLGVAAALDCLRNAGEPPSSIGLVLVSSGSPDIFCPGPASAIAARLGLGGTPAIDVPIASAGSIAALVMADSLTARFGNVLVVATEVMSRRISRTPEGKNNAILFGDGAGACLLCPDVYPDLREGEGFARIEAVSLHTDGERAGAIAVHDGRFSMDGMAVIRQASQKLPAVIAEVLGKAGVAAGDLDAVLIHQANLNLLDRVAKTLKLLPDRLFTNIQRYGNTSSASMLIAAAEWRERTPAPAAPIVLAAFGAGLTYGALLAMPTGSQAL